MAAVSSAASPGRWPGRHDRQEESRTDRPMGQVYARGGQPRASHWDRSSGGGWGGWGGWERSKSRTLLGDSSKDDSLKLTDAGQCIHAAHHLWSGKPYVSSLGSLFEINHALNGVTVGTNHALTGVTVGTHALSGVTVG